MGESVAKFETQVAVYIDGELARWLERKSDEGYKKASLIRHILREFMEKEGACNGNKRD